MAVNVKERWDPLWYQEEDAQHVYKRKSALIAHQPRVGKSMIAVRAADLLKAKLVIFVVPPNTRANWIRTIQFGRRGNWIGMVVGDNYAADLNAQVRRLKLRDYILVIDESHREKNRNSARTIACYGEECNGFGGLVEFATHVYCLTGTPLPNDPIELWPMLRAIAPELIMTDKGRPLSQSAFRDKYCKLVRTPFGAKSVGGKNYKQLKQVVMGSGFCLRRYRKDVFGNDLQEPKNLYITAGKQAMAQLKELENTVEGKAAMDAFARGDESAGMRAFARLEKKGYNMRRLYGLAKVPDLSDIISDRLDEDPGSKVVVGFYHTEVGQAYARALKKFNPLIYDGKVDRLRKDRINQQFQKEKKYRVILVQIQAGAVGLDLSAARSLIFAEWSFVGTDIEQLQSRIFNMHVDDPGFIEFAVLPGSIDTHIAAEAARKLTVAAKIFD
jgi:SWI/SNF-related matrix-associated actin-dependent regulator of chromatin subfamily A-like protein 1